MSLPLEMFVKQDKFVVPQHKIGVKWNNMGNSKWQQGSLQITDLAVAWQLPEITKVTDTRGKERIYMFKYKIKSILRV